MKSSYWIILIVLVVIVGGYLVMKGNASQMTSNVYGTSDTNAVLPTDTIPPIPSDTPMVLQKNSVVSESTDPNKGTYLTDAKGMTLYTFDNDQAGVSSCTGTCAQMWPPYTTKVVPTAMPTNIATLKRADGTTQYSWNGMPLYYYSQDTKPGDLSGDGVGGLWHLVTL